ncbi:MAG: response regulator [Hyphomicrobiaceae bacterium]
MAAAATKPGAALHNPTVLVVEDDVLIRLSAADALRSAGFAVVEAATGDEAVAVLGSSAAVDVVFTDIQMPGSIDGLGLAQFVRQTRPDLKIVVTSGHAPEWPSRDLADVFIGKPYSLDRVVERIKGLLGSD